MGQKVAAGLISGAAGSVAEQEVNIISGEQTEVDVTKLAIDTASGGLGGLVDEGIEVFKRTQQSLADDLVSEAVENIDEAGRVVDKSMNLIDEGISNLQKRRANSQWAEDSANGIFYDKPYPDSGFISDEAFHGALEGFEYASKAHDRYLNEIVDTMTDRSSEAVVDAANQSLRYQAILQSGMVSTDIAKSTDVQPLGRKP